MPQKRKRNHNKRGVVPPEVPGQERVLSFSFRYLQLDHPRFQMKNAEASFFIALLERMKYYEDMSVSNFVHEDSEQKRHPIVWEETNEKNGFPLIDPNSDEIGTDTAWQFCLQDGKGRAHHSWRVHGFLKDTVFHIVWLDDSHRLTGIENGFKKKK